MRSQAPATSRSPVFEFFLKLGCGSVKIAPVRKFLEIGSDNSRFTKAGRKCSQNVFPEMISIASFFDCTRMGRARAVCALEPRGVLRVLRRTACCVHRAAAVARDETGDGTELRVS